MQSHDGKYSLLAERNRPVIFAVLTVIPSLIVLCLLGNWQLDRHVWKTNLLAQIEARADSAPISFAAALRRFNSGEDLEYQPVKVTGEFDPPNEFHIFSQGPRGMMGFKVVAPFRPSTGEQIVFIDRGFVPADKKEAETRIAILRLHSVVGLLRTGDRRSGFTPSNEPEKNLWFSWSLDEMAEQKGLGDFVPFFLEADATPNPGDWPLGGQTRRNIPNSHLGYAFTWFGLAAALLAIFGIFCWTHFNPTIVDDHKV